MRSAEFSFGNMYFFGGRNNTLRNGIGGFFFTYTTAIGRCDGSVCFDGNTFGESKTSMTLLSSFYRLVAQEMTEGLRNWEPEKLVSWPTYARVQFENRKVQIEIPSALGNNVFFESYPAEDIHAYVHELIDISSAISITLYLEQELFFEYEIEPLTSSRDFYSNMAERAERPVVVGSAN